MICAACDQWAAPGDYRYFEGTMRCGEKFRFPICTSCDEPETIKAAAERWLREHKPLTSMLSYNTENSKGSD